MWGHKISDILKLPIQEVNPSNPRSFIKKQTQKVYSFPSIYLIPLQEVKSKLFIIITQMSTTFSTSPLLFQQFLGDFHPRKLLLHNPLSQPSSIASPSPSGNIQDPLNPNANGDKHFDINVVMVLIVLICALLVSLGLNSFIRCAVRCSYLNGNSSNRGIKKKALRTFPIENYSPEKSKLPGLDTQCVICISEFVHGDRVRILPKCSHGFHVKCIDEWLSSHSSCPTCRHCLMETCQKIAGVSQASSSEQPPSVAQERVVNIAPLEREGLVCNYREAS